MIYKEEKTREELWCCNHGKGIMMLPPW